MFQIDPQQCECLTPSCGAIYHCQACGCSISIPILTKAYHCTTFVRLNIDLDRCSIIREIRMPLEDKTVWGDRLHHWSAILSSNVIRSPVHPPKMDLTTRIGIHLRAGGNPCIQAV